MPDEPTGEAFEVPDSDITGIPDSDGEGIGAEFDRLLSESGQEEPATEEPTDAGKTDSESSQETPVEEEASKPIEEAAGEETLAPTEEGEQVPPTEGGFTFLERDYANQDAAEQAIRSHMGSVSSLSKRNAELEGLLKESTDALERQTTMGGKPDQRLKPDAPSPTPREGAPVQADAKGPPKWTDFYKPEVAAKIREDPDYGDDGAELYREQKMETYHQARDEYGRDAMLSEIRAENAPMREQAEQIRQVQEATEIFSSLADRVAYQPPDGEDPTYLYPELRVDKDFVEAVARRYHETPGHLEQGEYGGHMAYLEEKHFRDITGASPSTPGKKPSETVNADLDIEAKNRAALAAQSGSGQQTPRSRGSENTSDRINREFGEDGRQMGSDVTGIPGF